MQTVIDAFRQLRSPLGQAAPHYSELPQLHFHTSKGFQLGFSFFMGIMPMVTLATWVGFWVFSDLEGMALFNRAWSIGIISGLVVSGAYFFMPILYAVGVTLYYRRRPLRTCLSMFNGAQKSMSVCLIAAGGAWLAVITFPHHLPTTTHGWVTWVVLVPFLAIALPRLLPSQARAARRRIPKGKRQAQALPFGLWLGRSTGWLAQQWHQTGVAPDIDIVLSQTDAAQNILVLGGIGSGKTTRMMQPLLVQLLDQSCGGLLFDIKGDVKHAVCALSETTQTRVVLIGPHQQPMNLLDGLTPEVAASFLKSTFLLGGSKLESFWVDTATELCRNTLGILSFAPERYSLQGLYAYLFDDEARDAHQEALNQQLVTLPPEQTRLLKSYVHYHDVIFSAFDEKVKSGVLATIAQVLSPFNHPDLIDAFCTQPETPMLMREVLDGAILLVDMPLARWGLGGKVAYTIIKLRFFNLMQNRIHHPEWNQDRAVFFMCDEYQDIISANKDGLSDLSFWDKSRSSQTIGIISAQSVSSVYAAIGDRDLAHAVLQNFRQKICFKTEDNATLSMLDNIAGRAHRQRVSTTHSEGQSSGGWTSPQTTSESDTRSVSEHHESVIDAALVRQLPPSQAITLLTLDGRSMDDVLELKPVFL